MKPILVLNIKGDDWRVFLLHDRDYVEEFGHDSMACCIDHNNILAFNTRFVAYDVVLHEMFHAFYASCDVENANLKADQVEEIAATIVQKYVEQIVELSKLTYNKLKLAKKSMVKKKAKKKV